MAIYKHRLKIYLNEVNAFNLNDDYYPSWNEELTNEGLHKLKFIVTHLGTEAIIRNDDDYNIKKSNVGDYIVRYKYGLFKALSKEYFESIYILSI